MAAEKFAAKTWRPSGLGLGLEVGGWVPLGVVRLRPVTLCLDPPNLTRGFQGIQGFDLRSLGVRVILILPLCGCPVKGFLLGFRVSF